MTFRTILPNFYLIIYLSDLLVGMCFALLTVKKINIRGTL